MAILWGRPRNWIRILLNLIRDDNFFTKAAWLSLIQNVISQGVMFVIEDDWHAESLKGDYHTWDDAIDELCRLAAIPWDQKPNLAPCSGWRNCGRKYEVIEYDKNFTPWKLISRHSVLEIDAKGVRWESLEQR